MLYVFIFLVARAGWRDLRGSRTSAPRAVAELTILDPARSRWQPGARITLETGAVVGRDAAGTLVLDEDTVSARHATLRHDRGAWWIDDLGSTNGTFINGHPVRGSSRVSAGDEVRFGHVALRFEGEPRGAM